MTEQEVQPEEAQEEQPEQGESSPKKKRSRWAFFVIGVAVLLVGCVPCTGILAAIALPAFVNYTRRAKTSEATVNLRMLYAAANAYYEAEHVTAGGETQTHCTVGPATTSNSPGPEPQLVSVTEASFQDLGFSLPDFVYFQYEIAGPPSQCNVPPDSALYSFRAHGDLDGDGQRSLFEMSAGSDSNGAMYRAPGLFVVSELE